MSLPAPSTLHDLSGGANSYWPTVHKGADWSKLRGSGGHEWGIAKVYFYRRYTSLKTPQLLKELKYYSDNVYLSKVPLCNILVPLQTVQSSNQTFKQISGPARNEW